MAPSQIKSNIELVHRYRFVSSSPTPTAITGSSLLGCLGTVCTASNAQLVPFFGSVRVQSIEIWAPPAAQGGAATCSVEWIGSNNTPNREHSDTTVSTAQPAHVKAVPPPQSLASFWSTFASGSVATITAPTGSIIDLVVSAILFDDTNNTGTYTVTTSTLGNVYYLSLDPVASHRFAPVSLTTTF
jgi:hypothetical protein